MNARAALSRAAGLVAVALLGGLVALGGAAAAGQQLGGGNDGDDKRTLKVELGRQPQSPQG